MIKCHITGTRNSYKSCINDVTSALNKLNDAGCEIVDVCISNVPSGTQVTWCASIFYKYQNQRNFNLK
jgi:hypothetical protein